MREKLQGLAALQKVDLEVINLRKTSETYPKQIAELDKELAAAKSAFDAEKSKLSDLERTRSNLELTAQELKEKVKKWETRLAEQRSTREYSALAREIDIEKKSSITMGEQSSELTKQIAAQRELVGKREMEFAAKASELNTRIEAIKVKLADVDAQVKAFDGRRAEAASKVDAELLKKYDRIREKRTPAAVTLIPPGTCMGCRTNIPPQMYHTLLLGFGYDICPRCQRIIFAAEVLEPTAK
jgi:uncharacterized protein